jgi:hypothetical protein
MTGDLARGGFTNRSSIAAFVADRGLAVSVAIGLIFWYLTSDWIIIPAMLLLWSFWRFLPSDDAPPGLQFSFSYHLFQMVAGIFYYGLTERALQAHRAPQYHYMMVLAVASLAAIFAGFLIGHRLMASRHPVVPRMHFRMSLFQLFMAYVVAVLSRDVLAMFMDRFPALAQPIFALGAVQMGLLYLVLRRLFQENRLPLVLLLLIFETARGFTGFFSGFKEPVLLAIVAAVEVLKPRKVSHWAIVASLVLTVFVTSLLWLGIRGAIRTDFEQNSRTQTERLLFAIREAGYWWERDRETKMYDMDALIDRVWDIYYTALALDRVPSVIPHEDGAALTAAFRHVLMPRFLFPDKPDLPSESEDVRKYTLERVAGREQGTTIAFGYVIQSYIDFGVPLMFAPPLGLGVFLGLAYQWFLRRLHFEEILLAVLAVAFWANVMPYNVAWAKMLGKLLTSMVFVGGAAAIIDHVLYTARLRQMSDVGRTAYARQS